MEAIKSEYGPKLKKLEAFDEVKFNRQAEDVTKAMEEPSRSWMPVLPQLRQKTRKSRNST